MFLTTFFELYVFTLSPATVALTTSNIKEAVNAWVSNETEAKATYGDIKTWDVSTVTNMNGLFGSKRTFNDDISAWNVSSVTTMRRIFETAIAFNQDISEWDVSRVTDMKEMFRAAYAFNQDICAWGSKLPFDDRYFTTSRVFQASGCPNKDEPSFGSRTPGPFCYSCPDVPTQGMYVG